MVFRNLYGVEEDRGNNKYHTMVSCHVYRDEDSFSGYGIEVFTKLDNAGDEYDIFDGLEYELRDELSKRMKEEDESGFYIVFVTAWYEVVGGIDYSEVDADTVMEFDVLVTEEDFINTLEKVKKGG